MVSCLVASAQQLTRRELVEDVYNEVRTLYVVYLKKSDLDLAFPLFTGTETTYTVE